LPNQTKPNNNKQYIYILSILIDDDEKKRRGDPSYWMDWIGLDVVDVDVDKRTTNQPTKKTGNNRQKKIFRTHSIVYILIMETNYILSLLARFIGSL